MAIKRSELAAQLANQAAGPRQRAALPHQSLCPLVACFVTLSAPLSFRRSCAESVIRLSPPDIRTLDLAGFFSISFNGSMPYFPPWPKACHGSGSAPFCPSI